MVRCTRCGNTFRTFPPSGEIPSAAITQTVEPSKATPETAPPSEATERRGPGFSRRSDAAAARTPAEDIERLARVVFSDIEVYNPEKVFQAIRQGRFGEQFHDELEEARRMIQDRFPTVTDAVSQFDNALEQICERRLEKASTPQ
jgi:hypothetical protein